MCTKEKVSVRNERNFVRNVNDRHCHNITASDVKVCQPPACFVM